MKVEQINVSKLDIIGATLLPIEVAETLPLKIRKYKHWYWLRSQGNTLYSASLVFSDGFVDDRGVYVCDNSIVVRPALKIKKLESSNFKIGDRFVFGEKEFEIISKDLAFCIDDIGACAFREYLNIDNPNDYKKSSVKKFVDKWFKETKEENK